MARNKTPVEEKYNAPFPTALRTLMEERGETQENIAKAAGKTRQTISQYVNGISEPSYDALVKIADYFNVSTDFLLGRTADPMRQAYAVDQLALYPDTVSWIVSMKENTAVQGVFSVILEIPSVRHLMSRLCDYYFAVKTENIYDKIWLDFFMNVDDAGKVERINDDHVLDTFNTEIDRIVKNNEYGETISAFLSIHRKIWEATECDKPQIGPLVRDGFGVRELYSIKVNQCIKDVLSDIYALTFRGTASPKPVIDGAIKSFLTREYE